jgi:Bacteriophage minor capsid protein
MAGRSIPSEGIKNILVENSIGVFQPNAVITDWVIVISRLRDLPNKMISILDAGGREPEPGLDINYPAIHIIVRGEPDGYVDTYNKCLDIKDVLLGRKTEIRGGDTWASVTMPQDIIPLGYDENERPEFSLNFNLIIHQGDLSKTTRMNTQ